MRGSFITISSYLEQTGRHEHGVLTIIGMSDSLFGAWCDIRRAVYFAPSVLITSLCTDLTAALELQTHAVQELYLVGSRGSSKVY